MICSFGEIRAAIQTIDFETYNKNSEEVSITLNHRQWAVILGLLNRNLRITYDQCGNAYYKPNNYRGI